jgi:hypothetical protein
MAVKRLATAFEGTTNPPDSGPSIIPLDNGTGAMAGIARIGSGVSGQAGNVYSDALTFQISSLTYRSKTAGIEAPVTGAEILFRPKEGSPTPGGGDMPGIRLSMAWDSGPDDAGLFLDLQGNDIPGPMIDAELTASHAVDGVPIIEDTFDLTAHDWFGWHRLTWAPSGDWEIAVYGGSVLASGTLPAVSIDDPGVSGLSIELVVENYADGGGAPGVFNGAGALVDNLSVWMVGASACRMFPRDDGRGMSSAPRIWPLPKRNRIIGGYQ